MQKPAMNLRFLCIVLWVLMLAGLAGPAFAKITIGVVDGDKNSVVSADQARAIGHELAAQLQEAVDVKTYPDQDKTFSLPCSIWPFSRYKTHSEMRGRS